MLCLKSRPFHLLTTLFLVSSTFFSFCHGALRFHNFSTKTVQYGCKSGVALISWGPRRFVLEGSNAEVVQNSTQILAANITYRIDPLAKFTYYEGGWNFSNEHYLYSVAFTGIPLLATAATWFLIFGLCFLILCRCCCRRTESYGCSPIAYALSLVFLVTFTVIAITGSCILYTAQEKFHLRTNNILEYALKQEDTNIEKLNDVSDNLAAARHVGVDQIFLPPDIKNEIDKLVQAANISAMIPKRKVEQTSKKVQLVLEPLRKALSIVAASMPLLAFLGFIFSVFGVQRFVYPLTITGWTLVTVTFISCGISVILHNVVADTCFAIDEWFKHPTSHSALSELLPCMDYTTTQETLSLSKNVTFLMAGEVNQFIINVANSNATQSSGRTYYNQSGPLLPVLCHPFNADKTCRACSDGEMDSSNATQAWTHYVCEASPSGMCTSVGRLTPTYYDQIIAAVNVIYTLYHYGPFLVDLRDCTSVRETFHDVSKDHCPWLMRFSYRTYAGLVMLSIAVMLSSIFWLVFARETRHQPFTKKINPSVF